MRGQQPPAAPARLRLSAQPGVTGGRELPAAPLRAAAPRARGRRREAGQGGKRPLFPQPAEGIRRGSFCRTPRRGTAAGRNCPGCCGGPLPAAPHNARCPRRGELAGGASSSPAHGALPAPAHAVTQELFSSRGLPALFIWESPLTRFILQPRNIAGLLSLHGTRD